MSRLTKETEQGPPRGSGHYSNDGKGWWDDGRQQWFATTDQDDVLEIEAQDMHGTSWVRSVVTTLTSQYGTGSYRFVGRARSADSRWPTYSVSSGTFPVTPLGTLNDLEAQGAWSSEIKGRLRELEDRLVAEGWRKTGQGAHWWSQIYARPNLDWETPPGAYTGE